MNKIWAVTGASAQSIQAEQPTPEHVEMDRMRIGDEIANADGKWVLDTKKVIADIANAVQEFMDAKAKERGYDSIFTAVTYAGQTVDPVFQAEGQTFLDWRSLCWRECYNTLGQWEKGLIEAPSAESVIAELPVLVFPVEG